MKRPAVQADGVFDCRPHARDRGPAPWGAIADEVLNVSNDE